MFYKPKRIARGPFGYNEIMKIPQKVNLRLSKENQIDDKATGKVGRMTFSSRTMNDTKVGGETAAAATKHKDPKTLMGYVDADKGLLMETAFEIGKAVKNANNQNCLAGVELTPPPSPCQNKHNSLKRNWGDTEPNESNNNSNKLENYQ